MTKPKKAFAEMLVAARGSGDVDDICEHMSLMDIIYELKRLEKEEEPETPVKEPEPETLPPAPEPEPVPPPPMPCPGPPPKKVFRPSFWSRLANEEDDDE